MIVNNGHWKDSVHWKRRKNIANEFDFVFKENEWPPSVFSCQESREKKNKKSVSSFYVFYGTLHPKVECQFEFFPININYEAVSSRKSSVGLMHKYQGSIAGYRLGKKKRKIAKRRRKTNGQMLSV